MEKHIGEQDYSARELKPNVGTISAWSGNYELNVYSPNRKKEMHPLAVEFMQHETQVTCTEDETERQSLKIPRLS